MTEYEIAQIAVKILISNAQSGNHGSYESVFNELCRFHGFKKDEPAKNEADATAVREALEAEYKRGFETGRKWNKYERGYEEVRK